MQSRHIPSGLGGEGVTNVLLRVLSGIPIARRKSTLGDGLVADTLAPRSHVSRADINNYRNEMHVDGGPEFVLPIRCDRGVKRAGAVRYIEPCRPMQNGRIGSCNLRSEMPV
jgi:hypothetical protein